ncbi:MAG: hypothetical protein ACRDNS_09180, partial [Trebonia sp.]
MEDAAAGWATLGDPDGDGSTPGDGYVAHRPQALVFSFFGGVVRGRDLPPVPTPVFLKLLGGLGVAESAARATLSRMAERGQLERVQAGRVARYRLTPAGNALVRAASVRVSAQAPFEHANGQWTLL